MFASGSFPRSHVAGFVATALDDKPEVVLQSLPPLLHKLRGLYMCMQTGAHNMALTAPSAYFVVDGLFGWKMERGNFREMFLQLAMKLSELRVPAIDIPLHPLDTDKHLCMHVCCTVTTASHYNARNLLDKHESHLVLFLS